MNKDDCIAEINKALPHVELDFDTVVVIMLDRKTTKMANWFYFSGHPDHWGAKELSDIARQMSAMTAEHFKSDVNVGERKLKVRTKTYFQRPSAYDGGGTLLAIGKCLDEHDPKTRSWFIVEYALDFAFGISLRAGKGSAYSYPYWSLKFMFGPISLRFTWPK